MKFQDILEAQDYICYKTKEDFSKRFPPTEYGKYRPQPSIVPEAFPCMIREERTIDWPDSADEVIISVIYFPEDLD